MRADTKTISIHSTRERVVDFLSDPSNLPRWAVGFAKGVRRTGDRLDILPCALCCRIGHIVLQTKDGGPLRSHT
jgi:hypothetical protein